MKILNLLPPKQININTQIEQGELRPSFSGADDTFVDSRYWIRSAIEIAEKYKPKIDYNKGNEAYINLGEYEFILSNRVHFENMLDFENISKTSQKETLQWLNDTLTTTKNYNIDTSASQIKDLFKNKIAQFKKENTRAKQTLESVKNKLGKSSIIKNIENECLQEFCKECGKFNFINSNRSEFETFIDSVKKETTKVQTDLKRPEVKPEVPPKAPAKTRLDEYEELKAKAKNKKGEEWRLIQKEMLGIEKKAGAENVSLVKKREFAPNASEEERFEYFIKDVFPVMRCSEASTLDGLEMFEKYGMNKWYGKYMGENTMLNLTTGADTTRMFNDEAGKLKFERCITDKVASKYIDVYSKYAVKGRDTDHFVAYFEDAHKVISEETALKYIAAIKELIYCRSHATLVKVILTDSHIGSFKDNPRIIEAVNDLLEHVKDFPKR